MSRYQQLNLVIITIPLKQRVNPQQARETPQKSQG